MKTKVLVIVLLLFAQICFAQEQRPIPAAEQYEAYAPLLRSKRVALIVNQSSRVGQLHLLDFLLQHGVQVNKIFAPEHGFRGDADRGAHIDDTYDEKTGLPIIALFGKNKRPQAAQLSDVDLLIFDIQDVGVRFFTYISTMHEVMEACAQYGKPLLVLDRPNPLGDYVDGPLRKPGFESFVGKHEIPIVHGLTVGELAGMINGEGWLTNSAKCKLTVVPVANYTHQTSYSLPVKPSPNLPNDRAIRLYPSLCFFEATTVSIGRGTDFPFQVLGYPDSTWGDFSFVPVNKPGFQTNPLHEDKTCYGVDFRNDTIGDKFTLQFFMDAGKRFCDFDNFVNNRRWFNLLAGNASLLEKIEAGYTEEQIRAGWQSELNLYKIKRKAYLLYPE